MIVRHKSLRQQRLPYFLSDEEVLEILRRKDPGGAGPSTDLLSQIVPTADVYATEPWNVHDQLMAEAARTGTPALSRDFAIFFSKRRRWLGMRSVRAAGDGTWRTGQNAKLYDPDGKHVANRVYLKYHFFGLDKEEAKGKRKRRDGGVPYESKNAIPTQYIMYEFFFHCCSSRYEEMSLCVMKIREGATRAECEAVARKKAKIGQTGRQVLDSELEDYDAPANVRHAWEIAVARGNMRGTCSIEDRIRAYGFFCTTPERRRWFGPQPPPFLKPLFRNTAISAASLPPPRPDHLLSEMTAPEDKQQSVQSASAAAQTRQQMTAGDGGFLANRVGLRAGKNPLYHHPTEAKKKLAYEDYEGSAEEQSMASDSEETVSWECGDELSSATSSRKSRKIASGFRNVAVGAELSGCAGDPRSLLCYLSAPHEPSISRTAGEPSTMVTAQPQSESDHLLIEAAPSCSSIEPSQPRSSDS